MGKKPLPSRVRSATAGPARLRQRLVRRDILLSRLMVEAVDARAIVIEAPPGYGKSTVMEQWRELRSNEGWYTTWISLDSLDDEPVRFASLLIGAFPDLRQRSKAFASGGLPEIDAVVDCLLAHDFTTRPATLFVDDYHVIANDGIHRALCRLAAKAPDGFQLVISSRTALPLALAKARLSGAVIILREMDLAFDAGETHRLLSNICRCDLDPGQCERLRQRAGGWAAMLQLAGLALRESKNPAQFVEEFSGTDVEISRYLCEVTLDLLRPEIRRLLLATSPLDLFSPELCSALTDLANARALLAEIEDRHLLLIPLDRQGRWFKYHGLFREFLESRLDVDMPGEKGRLLSAASAWFYEAGEVELAVEHALRAGDHERAAAFAAKHIKDMSISRGEFATVQRWINELPDEIVDRHPSLKIGLAWAFAFRQRHDEANSLLSEVEADVGTALAVGRITGQAAASALATCDTVRVIIATAADRHTAALKLIRAFDRRRADSGLVEQAGIAVAKAYSAFALGHPREARRLVEEADDAVSKSRSPYAFGWNAVIKALLALFEGRVNDAIDLCRAIDEDDSTGTHPTGFVREQLSICLAEAYYEANRLEDARQAMADAGESAFGYATVELGESASRVLARLALAMGEEEEAVSILRRSITAARHTGLGRLVDLLGGELATCLIRLGRLSEAFVVDRQMGLSEPTPEEFAASIDMRHLTQARLALARGDAGRASRLATTLLNRSRSTGQVRREISALSLNAAAQALLGNTAESQRHATQAWLTASHADLHRSVIDEDYLLSPLAEHQPLLVVKNGLPENGIVANLSRLSPREGHVLSLISQGLTYQDIAETLVLSKETVKWHVSNIIKKLNARNRAHAVQIAYHSGKGTASETRG